MLKIIAILIIALIPLSQTIICPDKHRDCQTDTTCCQLSSGSYGCCPLPSAQCCSDGLHCCPNGTKCNDKEGTCDEEMTQDKQNPLLVEIKSTNLCPDKNMSCTASETCCRDREGGYACCPYKSGVCCTDRLHCCPRGTQCDVIHKQCLRQHQNEINAINSVEQKEKMKLMRNKSGVKVHDIVCPGGQYQCPDNNTCCQMGGQVWGCCPLQNAVCCQDQVHCCPSNTKCSPTGCE